MSQFVVEFGKGGTPAAIEGQLDAPAFHRNHEPIWSVIGPALAQVHGSVLEIGSGTGQHAVTYAGRTPNLTWYPSDIYDSHLTSIAAWRAQMVLPNLAEPQRIDLSNPNWMWQPGGTLTAMLCINVLHISPWTVSQNLIPGAGRFLGSDGRLFVYGPFMRDGRHTAPSNEAFDASLRAQNADWGVRDVAALAALAAEHRLRLTAVTPMPANNFVLTFGCAN